MAKKGRGKQIARFKRTMRKCKGKKGKAFKSCVKKGLKK